MKRVTLRYQSSAQRIDVGRRVIISFPFRNTIRSHLLRFKADCQLVDNSRGGVLWKQAIGPLNEAAGNATNFDLISKHAIGQIREVGLGRKHTVRHRTYVDVPDLGTRSAKHSKRSALRDLRYPSIVIEKEAVSQQRPNDVRRPHILLPNLVIRSRDASDQAQLLTSTYNPGSALGDALQLAFLVASLARILSGCTARSIAERQIPLYDTRPEGSSGQGFHFAKDFCFTPPLSIS